MQSSTYIPRIIDRELDELLPALPALALEGMKGVGKTETALRRATTQYRLDDPAQFAALEADPERALHAPRPVLIDEWQRLPSIWDSVRRAVDRGAEPASFLLTGSAAPSPEPTHTGAGRIVALRMRPLSLAERGLGPPGVSLRGLLTGAREAVQGTTDAGLEDYVEEIIQSGLPGLRRYRGRALRAQLSGYLERIIDSDFEDQGIRIRRPERLRRWINACAAATSTTASWETIRDAATGDEQDKPARSSTLPWREALERAWVLDPVPAWLPTQNYLKRLARSPKHHLADPALAASALGIDADALLSPTPSRGGTPRADLLLGRLFESLVTQSVRIYAQAAEARIGHLRQHRGEREIDLIVERRDRRVLAIEIKLGRTVDDDDVKHLRWIRELLGDDLLDAVLVNSGPQAYRRKDGIAVVPAALLGP